MCESVRAVCERRGLEAKVDSCVCACVTVCFCSTGDSRERWMQQGFYYKVSVEQ